MATGAGGVWEGFLEETTSGAEVGWEGASPMRTWTRGSKAEVGWEELAP